MEAECVRRAATATRRHRTRGCTCGLWGFHSLRERSGHGALHTTHPRPGRLLGALHRAQAAASARSTATRRSSSSSSPRRRTRSGSSSSTSSPRELGEQYGSSRACTGSSSTEAAHQADSSARGERGSRLVRRSCRVRPQPQQQGLARQLPRNVEAERADLLHDAGAGRVSSDVMLQTMTGGHPVIPNPFVGRRFGRSCTSRRSSGR